MSTTAPDVIGHDVLRDILSEAWRRGAAEPIAIHVRPEVHGVIAGCALPTTCPPPLPVSPRRVPLVVDDGIPPVPGFEIHRAAPPPLRSR